MTVPTVLIRPPIAVDVVVPSRDELPSYVGFWPHEVFATHETPS